MKALSVAHSAVNDFVLGILRCTSVAVLAGALLGRAFFEEELWTVDYWLPELVIFAAVAIGGLFLEWRTLDVTEWAAVILWAYCSTINLWQGCFSRHIFVWYTALLLFFLFLRRCPFSSRVLVRGVVVMTIVSALHFIVFYYGLLERPFFNNSSGYATAMACGFPFLVACFSTKMRLRSVFAAILCSVVLWSLWLASSRAACFGLLLALGTLGFYDKWRNLGLRTRRRAHLIVCVLVVVLLAVLYLLRPVSANGRLLVYGVSVGCVTDAPFFGHGSYGVLRDYMPAQADYFIANPQSQFADVAGNTPYVFNEVLSTVFKFGVVGLLLFIMLFFLLLRELRSSRFEKQRLAVLVVFCGVSLFSYSTEYPYLCLLLVCVVGTPYARKLKRETHYFVCGKYMRWTLPFVCMVLLCFVAYRVQAEIVWRKASDLAQQGKTLLALPLYEHIAPTLSDCPEFLYNFAAELNVAEEYDESNKLLQRCTKYLNDYDTELLAADNALAQHRYGIAEYHLCEANKMIPSRFMPLYGLLLVYEAYGDTAQLRKTAQRILSKSVKVNSLDVEEIKSVARDVLKVP